MKPLHIAPAPKLDIAANRSAPKWTRKELASRALWAFARPFFAFSPRPFWAWRRFLLRAFGAKIGRDVHIYPSVRITIPWNLDIAAESAIGERVVLYALGTITIGRQTSISQGAHLCAGSHDYRQPNLPLLKLPITIGSGCWVCADAFIGPGTAVGDLAIVGARAVVVNDIEGGMIAAGNPARIVKRRPPFGGDNTSIERKQTIAKQLGSGGTSDS